MKRYGLTQVLAGREGDFLTHGGRIVYHSSRAADAKAEMEWIWAPAIQRGRVRVREVPPDVPTEMLLPIRLHPDFLGIRWDPIQKQDFYGHGDKYRVIGVSA